MEPGGTQGPAHFETLREEAMRQPRTGGVMGVTALALMLALTAAPALAQQTIKVGAVFSLTGKLALLGLPSANAVKLAVKEINDAGGITVRNEKVKIDLLLKDDRGIPAEAVAAAVELITKNNVKFIFGPIGSVVGMPVVEITRKERVMQFTPLTQVGPLMGQPGYEYLFQTYNWEFGPQGRVNTYAPFIAKIARQEGVKSVAFLDSTDDYSQSILDAYVPKVKELGLNVLAVERYDRAGTTDFYPQLNKLKGLKPDALIWGYTDESGKLIIRQALEVGLTKKFFTSQGPSEIPALSYKDDIEFYTWVIGTRSPSSDDPKVKAFVQRYKAWMGQEPGPSGIWCFTFYDPLHMFVKAVEKAGTTSDLDKIRQALIGMTYEGVMKMTVSKEGRFVHDYYIGMIKKGKTEFLHVPLE